MSRIEKEKNTINLMIDIYCRKKHGSKKGELCEDCAELLAYANKRLDFCKFGEEKKFCSKCPIHCYKKDMKLKIKEVMKFSGPRLLLYSPMEVIKHVFEK
ncbi:nitrous oxide-stimulated promoter family protein [Romboutsia weinsteinii]|uniref:Nitrous oxide-stimulated promoter family protein n=1 Tax=Romboutsia weinsteinii TaxID=2020949 RepID=A0A371J823_9FIRM|nr:nitrous oxide-stimulated promoter family protein [Romboutsia weinsteinii]RDY28817.1 nitrous oxide-stimulated promoter family protein [Romboutsia weinsteinii]